MKSLIIALICGLTFTMTVEAQGMPRRDRGGSPRDRDPQRAAAAPMAQDPYAALEHELPSLKVDLRLTAEQVEGWSLFERDVREVAELGRARLRHLLSLRDSSEKPPTALALIATLAEEDRRKADATGDLKQHLDALYARLDDAQRRMLDRRVVLSQTQPLGG
ncbi:MAG: hypothetical protein ACXWAC_05235 [Usitatibacter sp.]